MGESGPIFMALFEKIIIANITNVFFGNNFVVDSEIAIPQLADYGSFYRSIHDAQPKECIWEFSTPPCKCSATGLKKCFDTEVRWFPQRTKSEMYGGGGGAIAI